MVANKEKMGLQSVLQVSNHSKAVYAFLDVIHMVFCHFFVDKDLAFLLFYIKNFVCSFAVILNFK